MARRGCAGSHRFVAFVDDDGSAIPRVESGSAGDARRGRHRPGYERVVESCGRERTRRHASDDRGRSTGGSVGGDGLSGLRAGCLLSFAAAMGSLIKKRRKRMRKKKHKKLLKKTRWQRRQQGK
jgi:hypothetical protein